MLQQLAKHIRLTISRSKLLILVLATTLGIVYAACAIAQSGAGSIQGTVSDSTGAVIPGAVIQITNIETGVLSTTKSSHVGFYQVPDLFTGSYSVSVTAPTMKTYKARVDLLVAQTAVINPVMTPGEVSQQVVVTGNTVQLADHDNGTISSTLEDDRINQLPENGRNLANLVNMTTPGIELNGERVNGLMYEAMEYLADGVTTSSMHYGSITIAAGNTAGEMVYLQDPDSVQEVQMNSVTANAQYASPATAVITTKSGTNKLHGDLFETALNNALGVAKGRGNPANYTAPPPHPQRVWHQRRRSYRPSSRLSR